MTSGTDAEATVRAAGDRFGRVDVLVNVASFSAARAIVVGTGSVLSHAAIVAREFALPAVGTTADATSNLVDSER